MTNIVNLKKDKFIFACKDKLQILQKDLDSTSYVPHN